MSKHFRSQYQSNVERAPASVGMCTYCGIDMFPHGSPQARIDPHCQLSRDHIMPVSLGGKGSRTVKACVGCNGMRGNANVAVFEYFMWNAGRKISPITARRKSWHEFLCLIQEVGFKTAMRSARATNTDLPAPISIANIAARVAARQQARA